MAALVIDVWWVTGVLVVALLAAVRSEREPE